MSARIEEGEEAAFELAQKVLSDLDEEDRRRIRDAAFSVDLDWIWRAERYDAEVKLRAKLGKDEIVGTADLVVVEKDGGLTVVDWKFGRPETASARRQVEAYAVAAADSIKKVDVVEVIEWYVVADKVIRWYVQVEEARKRIREIVRRARSQSRLRPENRTYGTGPHCSWCPGRGRCPVLARDVQVFEAAFDKITFDNAVDVLDRCNMIEKIVRAAKSRVRSLVEEAGGEIDLGDYALKLITVERKEHVVPASTYRTLRKVRKEST